MNRPAGGPVAAVGPKGFPSSSSSSTPFGAPPGMRPPTNAGRPGTGSSSGVPAGMRPPTSGGRAAPNSVGVQDVLQTDVNVLVRPVTGMASGVSGMPTGPLGPGRRIADKSYYLAELSKKLVDISNELDRMRSEIDRTAQDNNLYAQLERKYENQMKEVRILEGQLADFNLAFDKLRTNTNVGEIQEMYHHLKQRNEHEKKGVDDIFLKCQHQEKLTREIDNRISDLHSAAAQRIASLGEEKQSEYQDLQDELLGVNEMITDRESASINLEREISTYEETMKSDAYQLYQKGSSLTKDLHILARQKQDLEDELNSALSPGEIKEKLTKKILDSTSETGELERQVTRLESSIEKLGDAVRLKEVELGDAKKHGLKAKKYEAVYERDAKMQEFIQSFPAVKNVEAERKKKLKDTIVHLLRHISKGINNSAALASGGGDGNGAPDAEQFAAMKSELTFKEEKMADSKKTLATLHVELDKRKEELEKIDSLDAKISLEITQLQDKIVAMNEEMSSFKSEDELKLSSIQSRKDLTLDSSRAKKSREAIKMQVALLSTEYERRNKELQASDNYKKIENYETKLKNHAGAVFTLQEYIVAKKRESDYEGLLKECASVTKQINTLLIAEADRKK